MFLKGTHSHPNNTGVDLENTAARHLFIYSALLLIYFLTISLLFIHRRVVVSNKEKNSNILVIMTRPRIRNCLFFCRGGKPG